MLLVRFSPDLPVIQHLLHLGEQVGLLVIMVRLDKAEPRQSITDKINLLGLLNVRGLQVDGVEATNDAVVEETHMSGSGGEEVCLLKVISRIDQHRWILRIEKVSKPNLLRLELRSGNEAHWLIGPSCRWWLYVHGSRGAVDPDRIQKGLQGKEYGNPYGPHLEKEAKK